MEKENLNSIDWPNILQFLESKTSSELVREKIREISPLANEEKAYQSFSDIFSAAEILSENERLHLHHLDLSVSWLSRIEKAAILKVLELKDVRAFLLESISLIELLEQYETKFCEKLLENMMPCDEPLSAIEQLITADGEFKTDASETLFKLHAEKKSLTSDLKSSLSRLVKKNQMENVLQDRFVTTREGRWVVPVKSGMRHDLPGIIHGSSHSKQTVFMEPEEVVPVNNRIKKIDDEIEKEIERLLKDLSLYLHHCFSDLKETQETLLRTDFLFAQAELTLKLKSKPCVFKQGVVELRELRNPLLVLNDEKVIPNDLQMDEKKSALILSGPNAGGKTVLLKSVGLAAHMARCGLPICATDNSSLPFYKKLLVSVGDHQSVEENLSTFAAHLKELNEALNHAGVNTLLLIDEICGSTDPEEGGSLARSFIERYAKQKTFCIITSHLSLLKLDWPEDSGVISGCLEFDASSGHPTYRFIPGISGQSQAIMTAERTGVEASIINRAKQLLSQETRERLRQQDSLEKLKKDLTRLQNEARQKHHDLDREKRKYQDLNAKLEKESDELIQQNVSLAQEKLDSMVSHARIDEIFKNHTQLKKLKAEFPKVVKNKNREADAELSKEEFALKFPPGSTVYVSSLQQTALVQSKPNAKGEVSIQSQSMRLTLSWKELSSVAKNSSVKKDKVSRRNSRFSNSEEDNLHELDLRGKRVEEAIELLETHLDQSIKNELDRTKIIHGHGTDALKKSVRSHLSRSTYVSSWQAGSPELGGDGITWVSFSE